MASSVNFVIGDFEAQAKFREEHNDFIESFPTLTIAIEKAFNRSVENLELVDALILDLSSECLKRFSEIGLLCANGLGDGAFVVLRSMFEYLVTVRYLHLHPTKAEDFVNYLHVHMHTVLGQIERTFGPDHLTREFRDRVEKNFDQVKAKFTYSIKNGRRKTKSRWSDAGIVEMAIQAGLGKFVVLAYYLPIERAHPSMIYILNRQNQKREAPSQALMISHNMLIELLILQHEHFGIDELKPMIGQCLEEFGNVWKRYK